MCRREMQIKELQEARRDLSEDAEKLRVNMGSKLTALRQEKEKSEKSYEERHRWALEVNMRVEVNVRVIEGRVGVMRAAARARARAC